MGTENLGKIYVGLTDDPDRRRAEHGNPDDFRVTGPFSYHSVARAWERHMIARGCVGGSGGAGCRYGYTYTIRQHTLE